MKLSEKTRSSLQFTQCSYPALAGEPGLFYSRRL